MCCSPFRAVEMRRKHCPFGSESCDVGERRPRAARDSRMSGIAGWDRRLSEREYQYATSATSDASGGGTWARPEGCSRRTARLA